MNFQRFGGPWTEQKLAALERYLQAYLAIFTRNPRAAKFRRHYVDAFAGSGTRKIRDTATMHLDLDDAKEAVDFMDGSVRKADIFGNLPKPLAQPLLHGLPALENQALTDLPGYQPVSGFQFQCPAQCRRDDHPA